LCICAAIAAAAFAACAPKPSLVGCAPADPATITEAQTRVTDGRLKYGGTATGKDGRVFVSASLDQPGTKQDDDILTWVRLDGGFESVDEQARKHSTWPDAAIDVRADGARASRACVANYRTPTTTTKE
jgi:hypothetical protein